nr:polymer-forming cytoskeletal protein [uncultured Methanobacterium sp.]
MEKRKDLKIYGSGISSGGEFNRISIMGEGIIHGYVKCSNLKVYGEGQLDGSVKSADYVSIKGETIVKGDLNAQKVKVQGEFEVSGDLLVDDAKIQGSILVGRDFNAETLNLEGGFTIQGMLNGDILRINLYWPSKVNEIGGSDISVKKSGKLSFLGIKNNIMSDGKNELTADVIEGDNVYLENTNARVVRGNNITIGPGCNIELVEYKENFKTDEKSEVGVDKKI